MVPSPGRLLRLAVPILESTRRMQPRLPNHYEAFRQLGIDWLLIDWSNMLWANRLVSIYSPRRDCIIHVASNRGALAMAGNTTPNSVFI